MEKRVTKKRRKTKLKSRKQKEKKVSYHSKPDNLTLREWQIALRHQFGKNSNFKLLNNGTHPVFSDFLLTNPETGNQYRLAIRSHDNSANYCSCLDFKTNGLGICKHLGFALNKLERKRGNKKIFKAGYQQPHSSIYLDYRNDRQIKLSIGTDQQQEYEQLAKKYFDQNLVLQAKGYTQFEKLLEQGHHIHPSFRCYDDALEFVLQKRADLKRQRKIKRIFKEGLKSKAFSQLINLKLYDYQKKGVLFSLNAGRALLADDMGLGKTVQAITVAEFYKKYEKIERVLIVCPTSLKYQWKFEIERFTKSKAHVVEGSALKRWKQYQEEKSLYHIVGYRMAANDLRYINKMEPGLVILDEAQRIKNWKTKTSRAIKQIRSTYALVLTGTPIENKLEELYSIMQFIDQFRLGPLFRFLDKHLIKDPESGKILGYKNLKAIGTQLQEVMLRRTKTQVLRQLPKRQDKVLLVPMTEEQKEIHDELSDNVARLVYKWRKMKFLSEQDRKRLLLSLSKMRMVCDSTYILDQTTRFDTKILELMCILEEYFCQPEEKVVIFSQWSRMLNLVAEELESRNIPYQFLHGSVPSSQREGLLTTFREDPDCRIFLSTDAGGVGLNLQVASMVVNLDIPWNPAVLEQRIARVYRMGQTRAVQVINLVTARSIEHRMLDVLKFKHSMAKSVLEDGEDTIFLSNSKFKNFMGKVEDLTEGHAKSDYKESHQEIEQETREQSQPQSEPSQHDLLPEEPVLPTEATNDPVSPSSPADVTAPDAVLQNGIAFLKGMVATLQSPQKTQQLVEKITATDPQSGKTYLKIPIEDKNIVKSALQLLGGLLGK